MCSGKVYLIGAGPGDPGLITVRGAELLARADVIVNDALANPSLLKCAKPGAEIIYAGKRSRDHYLTQDQIIETIITHARAGKTVARLKGGDPFVFGRGGEEAEALAKAGIRFEIVPGITSAIAVPAYAGIPVTSRGEAVSFAVVTGHEAEDKPDSAIRWDHLATGVDTLVFLMGVENLPKIAEALIANGRAADTPVAVIQWGTHPKQRTVSSTLSNIVEVCREAGIAAPAITIVGSVVRLRDTISWFEKKPLFGRRVIVTRAAHQSSALTQRLTDLGAQVNEFPVIRFAPPHDTAVIDDAINSIDSFDWIIFTSANGVDFLLKRLADMGRDIRALGRAKLGAIGPKTAEALTDLKLKVEYIPTSYIAEAVVEQFPEDISGKQILIPRAQEAREELPAGLRARGAEVVVAPVYQTVTDTDSADPLRRFVESGEFDVITFTSASTVHSFFELVGDTPIPPHTVIACIGPITAEAARSHGLTPSVVADEYTIEGLTSALLRRSGG